ncbi:tRNA synthetases class I family protein, partial [Chlamydia psittaci 09DC79]
LERRFPIYIVILLTN